MKRIIVGAAVILIIATISVAYFALQTPKPTQIKIVGVVVTVELATTPAQLSKGLSGRDSMPSDHGMLFVFDSEDYWSFWMKDMKFPLDIIWFNSSRQAVYIEQALQPCSPDNCPIHTPSAKAMYVLEVIAGFVAVHDLALGDAFSFVTA